MQLLYGTAQAKVTFERIRNAFEMRPRLVQDASRTRSRCVSDVFERYLEPVPYLMHFFVLYHS